MEFSQKEIQQQIVLKLARRHAGENHPMPKDTIIAFFPPDEQERVESALEDLLSTDSPISTVDSENERIAITDQEAAKEYLSGYLNDFRLNALFPHTRPEYDAKPSPAQDNDDPGISDERPDELLSEVNGLRQELEDSDKAAEEWREEARRRQRLSIGLSITTFFLGIGATVFLQLFLF